MQSATSIITLAKSSVWFRRAYDILDLVHSWNDLGRLEKFFEAAGSDEPVKSPTEEMAYFLMEKLLTPMALALPLSYIFSMCAHVSLNRGVS